MRERPERYPLEAFLGAPDALLAEFRAGLTLIEQASHAGDDNVRAAKALAHFRTAREQTDIARWVGLADYHSAIALLLADQIDDGARFADRAAASLADARSHMLVGHIALQRRDWPVAFAALERAAELGLPSASAALSLLYTLNQQAEPALEHANAATAAHANVGAGLVELCLWQAKLALGLPVSECVFFSPPPLSPETRLTLSSIQLAPVFLSDDFHDADVVIFMMVDARYFGVYALPAMLSIAEHDPHLAVHVHIVNPAADTLEVAKRLQALAPRLRFRITSEEKYLPNTDAVALYCSCYRFLVLASVMESEEQGRTYWSVDADSLLIRPVPGDAFSFGDSPVGLRIFDHEPIWQRYCAASVCIKPTPAGMAFLRHVVWFIWAHLSSQRYRWFLDQAALHYAAQLLPPHALSPTLCALIETDETVLLTAAGIEKHDSETTYNQARRGYLAQISQMRA